MKIIDYYSHCTVRSGQQFPTPSSAEQTIKLISPQAKTILFIYTTRRYDKLSNGNVFQHFFETMVNRQLKYVGTWHKHSE